MDTWHDLGIACQPKKSTIKKNSPKFNLFVLSFVFRNYAGSFICLTGKLKTFFHRTEKVGTD